MRKVAELIIYAALMMSTSAICMACSDDNDNDSKTELPQDNNEDDSSDNTSGGGLKLPEEVVQKAHDIYARATTGPQEIRTVNQLAILTSICASIDTDGPISVTAASLNGSDVTLITLGGTQDKDGQATTMAESQLASFGKPNDYLAALTNLFENGTVPEGKPVIITGISLGGMIAQQLLGEKKVTDNYDIAHVITFGSPINVPLDRGSAHVTRFADKNDQVPVLGEMIVRNGIATGDTMTREELAAKLNELDEKEKIMAVSKYSEMLETHALSYIEDECWNATDFLGDKAKTNTLQLKEPMKFYPAPKQSK